MECLESGVFRSDLPTSFKVDPSAYEVCCLQKVVYPFHFLKISSCSGLEDEKGHSVC